jgi:hypothetical protein
MTSARLYRNPAFVSYLSAQTISFLGTGITTVVLPVLVYRVTGSPAAASPWARLWAACSLSSCRSG